MNLAGIFLGSFLAAIIFLVIMFIKDNSGVEETGMIRWGISFTVNHSTWPMMMVLKLNSLLSLE